MKKTFSGKEFLYAVAEAAVFWICVYFVQAYNLLNFDGVASTGFYAVVAVACYVIVFAAAYGRHALFGSRSITTPLLETLLFIAISIGPLMLLENIPQSKGFSILWMPGEWIKMPSAILFGARISFPFFAAYAALLLAALALWAKKGFAAAAYVLLAVPVGLALLCFPLLDGDRRGFLYVAVMCAPPAACAYFISGDYLRAAVRCAALTLVVCAVLPFYFGLLPFYPQDHGAAELICRLTPGCQMAIPENPSEPLPGATALYRGGPHPPHPDFPLPFMREFLYEKPHLFTTYGPTCGFVRFTEGAPLPDVMKYRSLIRYIWTEPGLPYFAGPDWINSDIVFVDKKSFTISKKLNLTELGITVPMDLKSDGEYAYVLSTEPPALARFRKKDFSFVDMLNFKELGLTPHSHGAYAFTIDPARREAFVQLGALDMKRNFRIVKIDLKTFTAGATRDFRNGSVIMRAIPEKGTFLTFDYYWRKVTEYDSETMNEIRSFSGPVNCRSAFYDAARDLLYMAGSGFGEFMVIDYKTGKTLRNDFIGNRAGPMVCDKKSDVLFLGSGYGVFSVPLEKLTGNTK